VIKNKIKHVNQIMELTEGKWKKINTANFKTDRMQKRERYKLKNDR
jgi:hypothetical protein